MNVEVRKSAHGTEYWDTKEKRVRFLPAGKKPGFEVTKEPKSMLKDDSSEFKVVKAVDMLDKMNDEKLLAYAKENNIEVPGNMRKEETIRNHIAEKLNVVGE
jgi:hypothetical protein